MTRRTRILSLLPLLLAAPAGPASAEVEASYRFHLANFSGPVPALWARVAVDRERNEVYALNPRRNDIRVFGEHGMELFAFGEGYPSAADLTIGDDGSIYLLTEGNKSFAIQRLNYRGEHVSEIPLRNVPEAYAGFVARDITYRGGLLYLVDPNRMQVIIVDERGYFAQAYDLKPLVLSTAPSQNAADRPLVDYDLAEQRYEFTDVSGFDVDANGNMYFTVGTLFTAFKLFPDGGFWTFGTAGSAPGKFGIASGIAVDEAGYVYVTDKLRSVVLVFDPELEFQMEFGYRGEGPSNLIVPDDLAIDTSGNLYVGQAANKGVSVFRVVHETARPSQGIDTDSVISGKPAQITEENLLSVRADFIADQGTDPSEDNRR